MNTRQTHISVFKQGVYLLVLVLLVLVVSEIIASIFYYHKYGNRKLALLELYHSVSSKIRLQKEEEEKRQLNYNNQQRCRPDSSRQMNEQVHDETMASNHFLFDPWMIFRNADYSGKYVNVDGYQRKSIPSFVGKGTDTVTIWFFGGSTMFGFHVADFETIPSQVASLYATDTSGKYSLRIVNYGIPYYYSFHEYKLFSQLLEQESAPDLAVFLDGLNDFWLYGNSYNKEPYFSNQLSELMNGINSSNLKNKKTKTTISPDRQLTAAQTDTLISNFLQTMKLIKNKAVANNVTPLLVIQPVPFFNYPNQKKDPICSQANYLVFKKAYPPLEQFFSQNVSLLFLGNLLKQETNLPFIDAIHYSPAFHKKIATAILERIIHLLKTKRTETRRFR